MNLATPLANQLQSKLQHLTRNASADEQTLCEQVLQWVSAQPDCDQEQLSQRLELLNLLAADVVTSCSTLLANLLPHKIEIDQLPFSIPNAVNRQLQQLQQLQDYHAAVKISTNKRAEGLRRLLLALVEDVRVVLVALINQLLALRAAEDETEQAQRLAEDTQMIYAPLANRLGVWQLKWELEDLAFRHAQPATYRRIANMLAEGRKERETFINQFLDELRQVLQENQIKAQVSGRPKHIYSIWRKMQKKDLSFEQLFDIRAVRVLVDEVKDCYAVLGLAHNQWIPVPGEFDDYIRLPKGNNYQSLHTAVSDSEGRTVEIQIRTHAMHEHAELGVAAHWRYKEGGAGDSQFERKILVMRQLLEAGEDGESSGLDDQSLLDSFQNITSEDRVYVLTPKGDVQDLSAGSTVLDFAYNIHSNIGNRCSGAKVNGRIVSLTHVLKTGERVEILTRKLPQPSRDWMNEKYLTSARNRAVVRRWFRKVDFDLNLRAGREALEAEFQRTALNIDDLDKICDNFNLNNSDELFAAVGAGDITPLQVTGALSRKLGGPEKQPGILVRRRKQPIKPNATGVHIEGVGNLLHQLAQCCKPLPGDRISGFLTQARGVSIHRSNCSNLQHMQAVEPERIVEVSWGAQQRVEYQTSIIIEAYDRKSLLKDISSEIAAADVSVVDMRGEDSADGHTKLFRLGVRIRDFEQLSRLLAKLLAVPNVIRAQRNLE